MLITARQAEEYLRSCLPLSRRQARRVLDAGLAGDPVRTRTAHLYDLAAVTALTRRPEVERDVIVSLLPPGIWVARRLVDARLPAGEQRAALADGWRLGLGRLGFLLFECDHRGFVPLVATVGGFVVAGAEIRGVGPGEQPDRHRFELAPPGEWFEGFTERRLVSGPGASGVLLGLQLYAAPERRLVPDSLMRQRRRQERAAGDPPA